MQYEIIEANSKVNLKKKIEEVTKGGTWKLGSYSKFGHIYSQVVYAEDKPKTVSRPKAKTGSKTK